MTRSLSIAIALLALAAPAALAGTAAKSPKALVLRVADFPRGATSGQAFTVPGKLASSYSISFNVRNGRREEVVTTEVAVARSPAGAARVYATTVAGNTGLPGHTPVPLPVYGDQQTADFFASPQRARGEVIVRRGRIVWHLTVESCGPLAPAGCLGGVTPPKLTKVEAIAELRKYAPRQKARVGRG